MKKELLSVLSLSLLISFAPSCKKESTSKKPKKTTMKKVDAWNFKVLDDVAFNEDEENDALAQADEANEEEVVTKF